MKKNTNELSNELISIMAQQTLPERKYNQEIPERWQCECCRVIYQTRDNKQLPHMFKSNFNQDQILCEQCYDYATNLTDHYKTILGDKKIAGLIHWVQISPEKDTYRMLIDFFEPGNYEDSVWISLPEVTGDLKFSKKPSEIFKELFKLIKL